jgi:hypothetical protein
MQELRELFFSTYAESGWSADNLSHILIQDEKKSNVVFELERVSGWVERRKVGVCCCSNAF